MAVGLERQGIVPGHRDLACTSCTGGRGRMQSVELGGGMAGCGIMHGDGVDVAQWQSVGVWGEWGVRRERR
jgi:hypothetical protein